MGSCKAPAPVSKRARSAQRCPAQPAEMRRRRIDNGRESLAPRTDILSKEYQRPVFVDNVKLALQIGLIKRRAHAPFGQIGKP